MNCTRSEAATSVSYFLMGLAAGGAAACLLAPCSGEDTRKAIGRRVSDAKAKAVDGMEAVKNQANDLMSRAESMVEQGKTTLANHGHRVEAAVTAARDAYANGGAS